MDGVGRRKLCRCRLFSSKDMHANERGKNASGTQNTDEHRADTTRKASECWNAGTLERWKHRESFEEKSFLFNTVPLLLESVSPGFLRQPPPPAVLSSFVFPEFILGMVLYRNSGPPPVL